MENFTLKSVKQDNDLSLGTINNFVFNSENTLPRKFTIPPLKSSKQPSAATTSKTTTLCNNSSNINQFLLKHLEEQANSTLKTSRFQLPVLASNPNGFNIAELRNGKLHEILKSRSSGSVQQDGSQSKSLNSKPEDVETQRQDHIIDLTTALSCAKISSNAINQSKKAEIDSFEIPFIDCDRQQQLPQTDTYCLIDISNTQFQHNLAPPSTLGKYLSSKTKRRVELPAKRESFKAKHQVQRFLFDTKSPDDLVLVSLNRFARTQ